MRQGWRGVLHILATVRVANALSSGWEFLRIAIADMRVGNDGSGFASTWCDSGRWKNKGILRYEIWMHMGWSDDGSDCIKARRKKDASERVYMRVPLL